ncbi:tudor domain-containing protein [Elysia marginata]|uniref:Tudor domain-containing protein n=1 Tax=Elysia marginata TaxID=1093978 RepID=A0AAV4J131_9GAST|nr:tudor domain-containing protein [Elysia marginata]
MEFPPQYCVTEVAAKDEDLFGLATDEEEENEGDEESEESEEESDMDDILCQEEDAGEADNAEENNETSQATVESSGPNMDDNDTNNSNFMSAKDETEHSNTESGDTEDSEVNSNKEDDEDDQKDEANKDDKDQNSIDSSEHVVCLHDTNPEEMQKDDGDQSVDKVGDAMEKILIVSSESKELSREEICQSIVDNIRLEEFGVGIELGETEQKLMKKQQERQGRSLQRLSKDLYSKDTHFVLELIQNADDNSYPQDVVPAVKFLIDDTSVKVMNNESGFEAKNIQALCDVGKSTKTKHTIGYIGQKGIGFKSVFRVTGRPEVHSNGFHICFDVDSGPMGYILPHWIGAPDTIENSTKESWQTQISLPWTDEIKQQLHTHAARFNDIKPSLLLFLHRLREITIDNRVDGVVTSMKRKDLGDGEIQISHSGITDRWLVVRKLLDASKVSIQMKAGVEVDSTEIALAFPLRGKNVSAQVKPSMLPVFAFLPLRTYGFRFIVQGDFDVPSSREDVDKDSSWNQWLRSEIHNLFIEALEAFKKRTDLTPLEALIQYLQFVPLENEVVDFFKPVTTHILAQLRASKCMPVLNGDKKAGISWKLPSQCVLVRDSLVREVVSSKLLEHRLGLHYLHPELSNVLDQSLADVLRVQVISTSHLLDIGGFISQNWDGQGNPDQVMEIAKWLACVYRSLDDFEENSIVFDQLNKMRVIPLADGTLIALADVTVFLLMENAGPPSEQTSSKAARNRDPLKELQKDLNIIHSALTSTPDAEVNSQVVKLLLRTEAVKELTAHDLIHGHIMPVLNSDVWQSKARDVIISYLIYIKTELDRQPSLIELSELKSVVRLATNHGVQSPQESSVHFSTAYGNKINLQSCFPGVNWTLVDAAYLSPNPSAIEKQSWHRFLNDLGVVDFLRVKPVERKFDKSNIHETPWAAYKDLWPDSPDGYVVTDYECNEFHQLVSTASRNDYSQSCAHKEMASLFELLDAQWSAEYRKCTHTQLQSGSGHILREVIETSFAIHLKTLPWIPAEWSTVTVDGDGKSPNVISKQDMCKASEIFVDCPVVRERLAHTVKYLRPAPQNNSHFVDFLGIKNNVTPDEATQAFISWCKRHPDKPNTPAILCTSWNHIFKLYSMIENDLSGKAAQDVFHNHPAIFVPVQSLSESNRMRNQFLVGKMMAREEVWWHDHTGLFAKYRESLQNYKSPLGTKSTLQQLYGTAMERLFSNTVRPEWNPTTLQLAELLKHIASAKTLFDEDILEDCLFLFSHIGACLSKIGEKVAGVSSPEASRAEAELQPVLSLLSDAAVFPSHRREWVNPAQQLLMLPDSPQLKEMLHSKPGVHFLLADLPKNIKAKRRHIDKSAIQHFVSLFESIKPLSECVKTEEITSGFQPCNSGQIYLHKVVGLIQRFLYFVFPDVYADVKLGQAEALKQLIFVEVHQLEVRYELKGHPEIFEIQQEKCMVKGNMFYFHQAHRSSQSEINREIAKYFSCGNESCRRGLLNFLAQAVLILEGKSEEPMQSLLSRQNVDIRELPQDEVVWEVPLPIIQEPEPEPEPQDSQMVYGRELDHGVFENTQNKGGTGEDGQEEGLKSWPPRSALNINESKKNTKTDSDKAEAPAGMWPPPRPPNSSRSARTLPSNIRVERELSQEEKEECKNTLDDSRPKGPGGPGAGRGRGSLSHQNSMSEEGDRSSSSGQARSSQDGDGADARHRTMQGSSTGGARDCQSKKDGNELGRDETQSAQTSSLKSQSSVEEVGSGEKRKRKASESLREGEPAVSKRINSQTDETINKGGESFPRDGANLDRPSSGQRQNNRDKGQDSSHEDHTGSSSNTDVTSSSSSTSQDSQTGHHKDRRKMHFTIPMWSESNQDLGYTDLSKDIAASLPGLDLEDLEHEQTDEILKTGRWGEMLVLDYLLRLKDSDSSIEAVLWANAEGEKGLPWDFEVVYFGMEGPDDSRSVYIEVKTTVTQDREIFEMSSRQLELALKEGENFQVYRVFGAGKPEPRLLRVENIAERMRTKQLKLYIVL